MKTLLRPAASLFVLLTVVTGIAYPLLVTGIAKGAFPEAANGSLIVKDGKTVGSRLIGQNFTDPKYFWGRPSATSPQPNNASASSGSNQGPLNPALVDAVKGRIDALKAADPGNTRPVPADLVNASASGLDPHISVEAALLQLDRICIARHLNPEMKKQLENIIPHFTEGRQLGFLGEERINVLKLNLELDKQFVVR